MVDMEGIPCSPLASLFCDLDKSCTGPTWVITKIGRYYSTRKITFTHHAAIISKHAPHDDYPMRRWYTIYEEQTNTDQSKVNVTLTILAYLPIFSMVLVFHSLSHDSSSIHI